MVAYTTTYNLAKPTVGDDEDVWGGYLNGNFDTLESLLKGTTALTAINVTGNITVGGNVDGRDIAADGSKLDGIESGATADQTASEILTAIKTVDGASSGLDADLLDGQQGSYYLNTSTTFGGDVSGTYNAIVVANDSHTHAFNNLTGKTSGTGEYSTSSHLVSGRGSGGVALTINDGYGNANVTFNHKQGVPEQNGNAARIEVNTDSTTGANMNFEVKSGVTSGTTVQTTSILNLSETQVTAYKPLDVTGAITASGAISSGGNTVLTTGDYDVQVCHLKTNVNSSVTQGVANEFTVNFNLEEHNDTSTFSHSSGVVTVATAGWYRIVANLVYENAVTSQRNTIRAYVKKNGTEVTSTATYDYDRGASYGEFSNNKINTMLYLAANDTIEIANYGQNIDGSVTIQSEECEFMISSETVQATSSNADTVDGYHASTSASNGTIVARNSSGHIYGSYYNGTGTFSTTGITSGMARFTGTNGADTFGRSYTPDAAKAAMGLATTDSPSFAGLNINGNLNAVDNIYVADVISHEGDSDTYIHFQDNTISVVTAGQGEITINSTGVRLGDTGNGYFQPVSGNYGSIQIDGGAHGSHEGYSIGGRAVFMHDNASRMGLYDDVNNEWGFLYDFNSAAQIFYNGLSKLQTTSSGVNIDGDLNAVDNVYVAANIYHEGDTDTYIGFTNNQLSFYAGNNHEMLINASGVFLVNSALHEDYDALSGTSPTVDPNNGGAFSLTMTGNTTFTFGGTTSGYGVGFVLQLTGNGSTVTWPTSVEWAGGTAPDAPASGETDIYVFWTRDGGTTWYGVLSVDAAA